MHHQMWQSQIGQDQYVVDFYKEKKDGYFVEIGANNGIFLSNTYALETRQNWKGICVEPIPSRFEECKVNRPNSQCFPQALFSTGYQWVNFTIEPADVLSGIHRKPTFSLLKKSKVIRVPTRTFQQLLEEAKAPFHIDYLSLDTEGTELDILQSVDLKKQTFGWMDVEHNYEEPKRSEIRKLLESNGYIFRRANQWDDTQVHSSQLSP